MFLSVIIQCVFLNFVSAESDWPILIVVSYDGFKYDYLRKDLTPSMVRLREEGTYADYMLNVFPPKTFPNHFSIATGMYVEEHGVIGNNFYDPALGRIVKFEEAMFKQDEDIVPIWTMNELSHRDRHSGCMMWPGSKYAYQNRKCTYFEPWDHNYDLFKRIDTAMTWLTNNEKPANLVMIYMEEPDWHAHMYGPDSPSVYDKIKLLDNVTQYLHNELRRNDLLHRTNVVHLGDHGMVGVKYQNIINITQYLDPNTYQLADNSPTLHVIPNEGQENIIFNQLKNASLKNGHFSVYRKRELPNRWHFKRNMRTPEIFLLANRGYAFQDLHDTIAKYQKKSSLNVTANSVFGLHGYDITIKDMYSFFMIRGPNINKNHKIEPFHCVDLYSLFAELLGIKSPRPRNAELIKEMIGPLTSSRSIWKTVIITVGGVVLSLFLVSCAAAVTIILIKRQQNMTSAAALNKRFPQTFQQTIEAQHLLDAEEA